MTVELEDTRGMSLSVEIGNSWYPSIGDLASICTARSLLVSYGGEKFVSKNVSSIDCCTVVDDLRLDIMESSLIRNCEGCVCRCIIRWDSEYKIINVHGLSV